jgi:hypothetical protein
MKRAPAALALVTLVFGCSTTTFVQGPVTPAIVRNIDDEHPDATIRVERLGDGAGAQPGSWMTLQRTLPERSNVRVYSKTTEDPNLNAKIQRWTITSTELSIPNSEIGRLTITSHARGALHGAGIGALVAAVEIGLVALALAAPCHQGPCLQLSPGETIALLGPPIAAPSILLGTGLGALIGADTTYVFK